MGYRTRQVAPWNIKVGMKTYYTQFNGDRVVRTVRSVTKTKQAPWTGVPVWTVGYEENHGEWDFYHGKLGKLPYQKFTEIQEDK